MSYANTLCSRNIGHHESPTTQLKARVIVADLTCGPFPGPGSSSERHVSMNPMREFIYRYDDHVEDAFNRFKKAHNKNYQDRTTHEKRKHNFRHNVRLVAVHWIMLYFFTTMRYINLCFTLHYGFKFRYAF